MTDPGPVEKAVAGTRASSRLEPFWLNPATIKGTIAVVIGLLIASFPEASSEAIRIAVGIALIANGTSDLWFGVRRPGARVGRAILEGLVSLFAGIGILVAPTESLTVISLLVGLYLAIRGAVAIGAALAARSDHKPWQFHAVRGGLLLVFGIVLILIPEDIVEAFIIVGAFAAMAIGAIMLVYGVQHHSEDHQTDLDAAAVSVIVKDWLKEQDVGEPRREEIGDGLYFEQPQRRAKLTAWWVMLLLSVAIATFGVLQDSTAVVIGAMLIAPLMTPILGAAGSIVNGWHARLAASVTLVAAGVAGAIGLAWIIGSWVPAIVPLSTNSQVTARISPNLVDMLIALAAGAAGAYANIDKRVSNSIAGVAIAVALVPPLAVVGLLLQASLFNDAWGAFLLFLTNFVSIVLAATFVFFLTGFAPFQRYRAHREEILSVLGTVVIAALIITVPLTFTANGVLRTSSRTSLAQAEVEEWVGDETDLSLVRVSIDGDTVSLVISGSDPLGEVPDLEDALTEAFGTPTTVFIEYIPTVLITYSDADGLEESTSGTG